MTNQVAKIDNRLGIFFFFDADHVVDDYVVTMLTDMQKNLNDLIIVSNGWLTRESELKLRQFTDNVIIRNNVGLDAWAYKTALDSYGWEKLAEFDEIVLFNATIMGPVYPFKEMFDEMNTRNIDFWGITWFHEVPFDPFGRLEDGYISRHIQSHFQAYRKSFHTSRAFQDYWDNLRPINDYLDSVCYHEIPFTKRFESLGFKSDVYVNTEDLNDFTYQPILFAPKQLIEEKRCPIFKRRSFFHDYDDVLEQSVGNATVDLYEYLRDHTDFDTDLIWQNALRSMHMADFVKNLQLNHVLPVEYSKYQPDPKKVALVLHVYYLDLLDKTLEYAKSMPEGSDIIITTGSEEKVAAVEQACKDLPYNVIVRLIENRGRDVSALLVGAKDLINNYEVVCFAHDKKVTQLKPYSKGDGFAIKCFENLLPSQDFVNNTLELFADNPRLGMVMPTAPNHAEYFPVSVFSWGPNFENTRDLLERLDVKVPLSPEKDVIAPLGTMFWFRPQALKPLFDYDWEYNDFPPEPNNIDGTLLHAVERAYAYIGQGAGYYSGWLHSDKFARIELTNLAYQSAELTKAISRHWSLASHAHIIRSMGAVNATRSHAKELAKRIVPNRLHSFGRKVYTKIRQVIK